MKKILVLLTIALATFATRAQVQLVDTNTPHVVGTNIIYGDPLPVAFTKINLSLLWLNRFCETNRMTNAALSAAVQSITTNLYAVSNLVIAAQAQAALFPSFTNWFYPDYWILKTNQTWLGVIVLSFPGGNIQNGTVNSNKFDFDTLTWLQSCPVPGANLLDIYNSYGSANYVPVADGSGTWTWGAVPIPDTLKVNLLDSGYSSGYTGYVPVANGDGTWTWGAGGGGGATVDVTNAITGDPGTDVVVTNLGSTVAAVFQFTIPRGDP